MAPEFFVEDDKPKYDKSVDVFAMGLLFLTMFQAKPGKPLQQPKCGNFAKLCSQTINGVFLNWLVWFKSWSNLFTLNAVADPRFRRWTNLLVCQFFWKLQENEEFLTGRVIPSAPLDRPLNCNLIWHVGFDAGQLPIGWKNKHVLHSCLELSPCPLMGVPSCSIPGWGYPCSVQEAYPILPRGTPWTGLRTGLGAGPVTGLGGRNEALKNFFCICLFLCILYPHKQREELLESCQCQLEFRCRTAREEKFPNLN